MSFILLLSGMKTIYGDILLQGSKQIESKIEATEGFSAECINKVSCI